MKGVIFDLDQTIIDSSIAEKERSNRQWSEVYSLIPYFKLYEGIRELMSELVLNDFKIAIVTSSPGVYTDKVLEHFKISYNTKVCYHDVLRRKPYADQYLKAINILGLLPSDTFALGDRSIDIEAAHNARIQSCACYWGALDKDILRNSKPTYNFETVSDAIIFFKNYVETTKIF
jgi:HAD superfamily hydrolase (TIGR01549 family)